MTQPQPYVPTAREQKFLESVEEGRYEREIISGLAPFFNEKAPADMLSFYAPDEVTRLKALKGTDRDVEARMPVRSRAITTSWPGPAPRFSASSRPTPPRQWISRARRIPATRWTTAPSRACSTSTRWDSCTSWRPAPRIAVSAIAKN